MESKNQQENAHYEEKQKAICFPSCLDYSKTSIKLKTIFPFFLRLLPSLEQINFFSVIKVAATIELL